MKLPKYLKMHHEAIMDLRSKGLLTNSAIKGFLDNIIKTANRAFGEIFKFRLTEDPYDYVLGIMVEFPLCGKEKFYDYTTDFKELFAKLFQFSEKYIQGMSHNLGIRLGSEPLFVDESGRKYFVEYGVVEVPEGFSMNPKMKDNIERMLRLDELKFVVNKGIEYVDIHSFKHEDLCKLEF